MDYDWLYDQYVVKNRRTADIAAEYGCKQNTIQCWLSKHGIKKEIKTHYHKPKHQYEMYDYLYRNHIELGKSMSQIARENCVSQDTIRHNLLKNKIDIHRSEPRKKYTDKDIDNMVDMYCNKKMSANEISKIFNTSHSTIIKKLHERGIDTRNMIEAQYNYNGKEIGEDLLNKELLYDLHWHQGLSCKDIGNRYGVDPGTIRRQMKRLGIKTKNNSESKIGLVSGEKHHNWRGGITPLNLLLREFFHINQAPVVASRDNYTCQMCGKTHTILHVHHKKHFSDIISEICNEHPDLQPNNTDGKQKLYDIITHDPRFLDNDNLITLCKECHIKIHNPKNKIISSRASNSEEGSETIPLWEYVISD